MDAGDRGRGSTIVDGVAGIDLEQRLANARLIAAAPDLLAALQKIAEEDRHDVRTLSDQGPVYIHGPCGTIAIEAIAKATGETL